jgi:hypothetical protein
MPNPFAEITDLPSRTTVLEMPPPATIIPLEMLEIKDDESIFTIVSLRDELAIGGTMTQRRFPPPSIRVVG